ncbi:hypothetical protein AAFC00_000851 [Neodothiora populina]|uniref:Uncharacterized protein n=1 Tax=Neodothiora populina TaxID=2781224 RepID=A0ABR3PM03_9PEZI
MLEEIPIAEQYVFTSMRYDAGNLKSGPIKRNSFNSGKAHNPPCTNCPDASVSAYLMKYHYERLICAADHLGWYNMDKTLKGPVELFNRVEKAVAEHKRKSGNKCPFKVRVCLRHNGKVEFGIDPILSPKPALLFPETFELNKQSHSAGTTKPIFKVVLDVLPTRNTAYTRDKTYYRTMYNYARHCAGIQSYQDAKEVLLYNKDNFIMDGSITTPYFHRDGKWVTPHNDCGGQQGTTRRWAIEHGLCYVGYVPIDSLRRGEIIWLSNGVKGFFTARVLVSRDVSRPPSIDLTDSSEGENLSPASSRSSVAVVPALPQSPVITHDEEIREDEVEARRKYPAAEGSDTFRNEAFSLDVFDKSLKL